MFQEKVNGSQSYFHAKFRKIPGHVTNPRDWKTELKVNKYDYGAVERDKRYLNPRLGAKYFGESKATVRAELAARAKGPLAPLPLIDFRSFLAFEVVFRPETEVFSMVGVQLPQQSSLRSMESPSPNARIQITMKPPFGWPSK